MRDTRLPRVLAVVFLAWIAFSGGSALAGEPPTYDLKITSQPLGSALQELARQSGIQIIFFSKATDGRQSPAVQGHLTIDAALRRMLGGSHLTYRRLKPKLIEIREPAATGEVSRADGPGASAAQIRRSAANGAVSAPVQPARELQQVVVTARLTKESLVRAPVAVVAMTPRQLQLNDATDLEKIGELAPQVMIGTYGSAAGAVLTIRGISSNPADAGLDPSVLVVVDGMPVSNGGIVTTAAFDMQQVQVMEGPQALFFGKNSPAGVISLSSADPTSTPEGYVKAGYEFDAAERFAEGAISGPITSNLSARLAFRVDSMGGWMHNIATPVADPLDPAVTFPGAAQGDTGPQSRDYAGRLTLLWAPSDDFDAKLKLALDHQRLNDIAAYSEEYCTGGATVPVYLGIPEVGADCSKNMVTEVTAQAPQFAANLPYANDGVPYMLSDMTLASLALDKRFDKVTVTSISGYYNQARSGLQGGIGLFALTSDADHNHFDEFSEQLRANTSLSGPVNFMGGVYLEASNRGWFNMADILNIFNPSADNYATTELNAYGRDKYYSAFGQVRWDIMPSVELAAGARYSHDSRSSALENLVNNPAAAGIGLNLYPQGEVLPVHSTGNNVSPEVTLAWHPRPNATLYAAYKRGYQAGGISNPELLYVYNNAQNTKFGPETAQGFELGYKASLLDNTLRLDLNGYTYKYHDLQVVSENVEYFTFLVSNAGAAATQGVQGSLEWLALDRLTLHSTLGYNHAYYLVYPGAECYAGQTAAQGCVDGVQDLAGKPLTRAPKITYDLGADYKAAFIGGWTADMSVDGAYTSSYQAGSTNPPGGIQPAFWRLDAALSFISGDGNLVLSVIGRDLTNSYYLITSDPLPLGANNDYFGFFARPREVILQAEYHF